MSSRHGLAQIGEWRPLGRIGLLFGAVLASVALLCVTAPSAFAKEQVGFYLAGEESEEEESQPRFEAEAYPAYLLGNGGKHKWGFQGGTVECLSSTFFGQLSSQTPTLTLATLYLGCGNSLSVPMSIFAHGCEPTVTVLNAGPPYVGEWGMQCPGSQPFQFVLNLGGGATCTISIPAQTGVDEVSFENTGEGAERAVEVDFDVSGMEYSLESSISEACNGAFNNGTYTGTVTLEGFDEP